MRNNDKSVRLAASKPRNVIFRAMLAMGKRGSRHDAGHRQRDRDRRDLDQRVRESGEW